MNTHFIIIFLAFAFVLSASFFYLSYINQKVSNEDMDRKSSLAYLGLYIISSISFSILYVTTYDTYTFKYDFSFYDLLTAVIFTGLIFGAYTFQKLRKVSPLILLSGCVASSFFIPESYYLFQSSYSVWVDRSFFAAALFIFSLVYKYINTIDGILVSQNGAIGIGATGLALILNAPLIGAFGLIILASSLGLLFFNKYPAKIQINEAVATSMAFFLGWFLIKIAEEISITNSLLLISFVIIEVGLSFVKRLTFLEKYRNIYANGFCAGASVRGLYPDIIRINISRVLILAVLLSCFQTFAPNLYSIPLFGSFALIWFLYRMQEWEYYGKSLKEINQDAVDGIKENIDEIKKYINKN